MFSTLVAQVLVPAALSVVSSVVSWVGFEIAKYVRTKTKNEKINNALAAVTDTVESVVAELDETVVRELKKASSDGRISSGDALKIKTEAVESVKKQLPGVVKSAVSMSAETLDLFIKTRIERAVSEKKKKG